MVQDALDLKPAPAVTMPLTVPANLSESWGLPSVATSVKSEHLS